MKNTQRRTLLDLRDAIAAQADELDHWRLVALDLAGQVVELREVARALAERVASQSELLSQRAEKA